MRTRLGVILLLLSIGLPLVFVISAPVSASGVESLASASGTYYRAWVQLEVPPRWALGGALRFRGTVKNTGNEHFPNNAALVVWVYPGPHKPCDSIYGGWWYECLGVGGVRGFEFDPGVTVNIPGYYNVLASVMVDSDGDGVFEYPHESIGESRAAFTVLGAEYYRVDVQMWFVRVAALGLPSAIAGGLLGRRFLFGGL